jgi:hypothetical protein
VGFAGVVREGRTLTAPHFGDRLWHDFPLAAALSKRLDKPVRLLNDAEIQSFGIVKGRGLKVVLTLGTGAGTAVFRDGVLMPHRGDGDKVINPPKGVRIESNHVGITGGIRLWNADVAQLLFCDDVDSVLLRTPRPSIRNRRRGAPPKAVEGDFS